MLRFIVNGQTLTRVDKFNPATDSEGYLQARFEFSADWAGTAKVAQFRNALSGRAYQAALDGSGACTVPAEVLTCEASSRNYFTVNVYGVSSDIPRVTTNELRVDLKVSGYGPASTPAEPTPDVYEQLLAAYADTQTTSERLTEACGDSIIVFDPLFTESANLYNVDASGVIFSESRWVGNFSKSGAYSVVKYLFEAGRKYLLNAKVFGHFTGGTQTGRFSYFTTSYGWGDEIIDFNAPDGGSDFVSCILEPSESSWLSIFSNTDGAVPFEVELYAYDVTDMPDKVLSRVDFSTVIGKTSFSVADQALYVVHAGTADEALTARGKWYGKTAWFCGDSITDYGWYPSRLAAALGLADFYQDGHSGQAISGCAADIVARPSLLDGYDLLTVFAGTNDFGGNKDLGSIDSAPDTSTTYGSLKLTIQTVVTAKPDLRVVFFTPLPRGAFETQPAYGAANGKGHALTDYCRAVKDVCELYHIPVVDLYNLVGWNEFNITTKTLDGLHPTQEHTISDLVPLMATQLNCL